MFGWPQASAMLRKSYALSISDLGGASGLRRTGLYSLRSTSPADPETGMPGLGPSGDDPSREK